MSAIDDPIPSPCVRNCCLDDEEICLGCHRSLDEIKEWGIADQARRRAILQDAAQRKQVRARAANS
jgi:uncharacterized protein